MIEPGDTLWAWQERTDEGWGVIAAYIPMMGLPGALVTRSETVALDMFAPLAVGHVRETGNPLRLARFALEGVVDER